MSLDAPYQGDEDTVDRLGDLIGDPLSEQAYDEVLTQAAGDSVRTLLSTLTERERQVLQWRLGVESEALSLRQVGRRLGMSAERVRQIEQRALIKLRSGLSLGVDTSRVVLTPPGRDRTPGEEVHHHGRVSR